MEHASKPTRLATASAVQLESPFFTLDQAAAHARCSTRTIQRWLEAGELTRYGHGRKVLIHRGELETLLSPTPANKEAA